MPIPITIPRLGWNMEEGVFVGWLKRDGDEIKAGESLFSLESEKATEDVECLDSGILRIGANSPKAGDPVRVGDVIGYLLQPGEALQAEPTPLIGWAKSSRPTIPMSGKMVGLEDSAHPTARTKARPAISPRARRVAAELGIDCTNLKGTGRTGRIREQDVRALASRVGSFGQTPGAGPGPELTANAIPISSVRRTIAERLRHSLNTTAPVTVTTTADAQNLADFRNQFKTLTADNIDQPSFTDLFVRLTALALKDHPRLNSRWENNQVLEIQQINIGIAIDTEIGLMAPVIHDAARLTLQEISRRTGDLIDRARQGKLHRKEMEGGTFTISNLGAFGIDAFTPIINWPECAVLGIGRIRRQPVVTERGIEPREQITLSLTFDHRIIDGAAAARFLQSLVELVENPAPVIGQALA
jgi:pyruvate dehydrogenase E2 component (dihydrolipoamide acetyltransferase)